MAAEATTPTCPRCGSKDTTPLAREEDRQRHQCVKCSENFWAPAAPQVDQAPPAAAERRFSYVPIAVPDGGIGRGSGDPVDSCPKCKKPYYKTGKRFQDHVAACDGKPYVAPKPRVPRQPRATPYPPDTAKVYDMSIAALLARKAALEAEIRGIDAAVLEIQKLKGAGGAAPLPFPHGTTPKLCAP